MKIVCMGDILRANFRKWKAFYGYSDGQVAKGMGISKATLFRRLQDPSTFTWGEIQAMLRLFHTDINEMTGGKQ